MVAVPGQYIQPVEQARWQVQNSVFRCAMQQTVTGLGRVSFVVEPAKPLYLSFDILRPNFYLQQAVVAAHGADWQPAHIVPDVFFQAERVTAVQASFDSAAASLLQYIHLGYWLQFDMQAGAADGFKLLLTSVHGKQSVDEFRQCVSQMSPLSWDMARDSQLMFEAGQRIVSVEQLNSLQDLVRYTELDKAVSKILIDGHADDVSASLANRLLSQERADDVASRLIEMGVKSSMIEVRAHGNRYPVIDKKNAGAEQHNRRVVIRLIRKAT